MSEAQHSARIVLTTAGSLEEARRIARTLVEERLAACTSIVPAVESIYRWRGETESTTEALLLIKTSAEKIEPLEARLHQLHSYETPEFLVLPVDSGSAAYLDWLFSCLRPKHP
jgi:periplasmic divalent cation tolerance protein